MTEPARPLMMGDTDRVRATGRRSRPKKAPSAFRTISEVADQLHIPQHVLRFWETKFPQVKPMKRGGGRRYYRPDDIGLLRRISDMLYIQGYTIKGVQRLLREGGGKLADELPPPNPQDIDSDEQGKEGDMNVMAAPNPELPMPGLTPAPRPASTNLRQANARAQQAEAEVDRLRGLLEDVLKELEALRAQLN